jgi:hypothetical protein
MSSAFPRRLACWSFASLLVIATVVSAQSDNRLEQIRRLKRVEAQKTEADIRDAVKEAVSLMKSDPSTALEILEAALNTAEKDPALSDTQRDALKKLVNGHIRDAKGAGGKSEAKEANTARQKEAKSRKDDERSRVADEARDTIERARAGIRQSREVRGKQASGLAGVDRDVGKSATPSTQDMEFPKNWKELVAKRGNGPQMTKAEKALMKALDSVIEANFDNNRFEDVIKYLEEKTGVTILLDKLALEQQAVTYETTVKFRARKVTMRTVLRRILGDLGLTYYIKDEAIQVTSPDKAKDVTSLRTYYLGDIVTRINFDLGPVLNQQQVLDNAKRIIEMIQTQIEPESWSINNGSGKIYFDPLHMVLVVRANAEVHYMLGGGMK